MVPTQQRLKNKHKPLMFVEDLDKVDLMEDNQDKEVQAVDKMDTHI